MATLQSLSQAIPSHLNFELLLEQVKDKVSELIKSHKNSQQLKDELVKASDAIEDAQKVLNSLGSILSSVNPTSNTTNFDQAINEVFILLNSAINLLKAHSVDDYQRLLNSKTYKAINKLEKEWLKWSLDIGQQTETINGSFDHISQFTNTSHIANSAKLDVGIKLNANAEFNLEVMSSEEAKAATNMALPANSVMINQDLKAMFDINASASVSHNVISLVAKANAKGIFELDSYYQTLATQKTYSVIHGMYKTPLLPWDLSNMAQVLTMPNINNHAEGYRAFSFVRDSSFGLTGELKVGKSLSAITDINNCAIDLNMRAQLTLSRQFSINGKLEIFITKNERNQVVIHVSTLDANTLTKGTEFSLGAGIKGLDKVIEPHIKFILGKEDKLVAIAAKYNNPGHLLTKELLKVADNNWAKPLIKVLFGENTVEAAVKELLGDEIEQAMNKQLLSLSSESSTMAETVVDELISVFGVEKSKITSNTTLHNQLKKATKYIQTKIENLKKEAEKAAKTIAQRVNAKAIEELAPLKKLGQDVGQAIDHFDNNANDLFEKILTRYREFSEKLKAALEKSADIQLDYQYKSLRQTTEKEEESFSVTILNPNSNAVKTLYRSIILGDDRTTSTLLDKLSPTEILYKPNSLSLNKVIQSKVSLGINVLGYNTNNTHDVVSDLRVKLDPSGKITLVHQYNVDAMASGFDEKRAATFNLSYGLANAALDKNVNGAIAFNYSNKDNKLHSVPEIKRLLDSLTLQGLDEDLNQLNFSPIISEKEAYTALADFQNYTTSFGTSTTKYLPNKSKSELAVTMRTTEKTFEKLLNINADSIFNNALLALIYSDDSRYKNGAIRTHYQPKMMDIISAYQSINISYLNLSKLYEQLDKEETIGWKQLKLGLKTSSNFDQRFSHFDDKDWKACGRRLWGYMKKASALKHLVEELNNICDYVALLPDELKSEDAKDLMVKLNGSNTRIQAVLDKWINVEDAWQDIINDFFSAMGFDVSGLQSTLLLFMVLLQKSMKEKDLYLVKIALSKNDGTRRNILQVS